MLHENIGFNAAGHLTFAGMDTIALCQKYGTPLMLCDENRLRRNMRIYVEAMRTFFTPDSHPLLASKALCFKEIYRIAASEGMYTDIVSPGELYTACAAGAGSAFRRSSSDAPSMAFTVPKRLRSACLRASPTPGMPSNLPR